MSQELSSSFWIVVTASEHALSEMEDVAMESWRTA